MSAPSETRSQDPGLLPAGDIIWKLDDLYGGPQDPRIEADKQWIWQEAARLAETYRGAVSGLDPASLARVIREYESLHERLGKLNAYAYLYFSTRTQDPGAGIFLQSIREFQSLIHRDTLFFELEWTQVEDAKASLVLAHPDLAPYRHYLDSVRRYKAHMLTEPEERILAEKEPVCTSSWNILFDKVIGRLRFGAAQRTEAQVLGDLQNSDRTARKQAARDLTQGLSGVLHILTHIFNTILQDKAITDRLKKYPDWLSERNLANEADDRMVDALVRAVLSRYDIVQHYYGLKRRLLGYDELFDFDRYAPVPGIAERNIPFHEAREIVLEGFQEFSPDFASIARRFFDQGWIHAPALPGKRGGAFSHSTIPACHPYILLNYTGTHRDVMTLAHELGHGVHQVLARKQGLFNSETPLTMAETASVFAEMLTFRRLLGLASSRPERTALLCAKIEDIFATVFRQVSMNRFEDAVHNERRRSGELEEERISQIWLETQTQMFGTSVALTPDYGIWWSYIPHFLHTPGYVYAYAFGELLTLALYQQYAQKDSAFVPLYTKLLEAGGKAKPEELLAPFGIDLADLSFWDRGLKILERLLDELEEEIARQ